MNHAEFLAQFENCTLPKDYFKHRGHLRLAWLYLSAHSLEVAIEKTKSSLFRYASSLGAAAIFHVTLTESWVRLVHEAMVAASVNDFDELLQQSPWLMNKLLIAEHYSQALLDSESARQGFVPPDLKPFACSRP